MRPRRQAIGRRTDTLEPITSGHAIEPPDEIADDWQALADGLEKVAGTLEGADPNDPQVAAEVQSDLQAIQEPATNVETYLQEQCGIDTSESATPSS